MRKLIAKSPAYVLLYLLVMLPTYILPYMGSNSHVLRATGNAINREMGSGAQLSSAPFFWHTLFLAILCYVAFLRGKDVGKSWLVIFPVLAAFFDLMPGFSMIPLVPTVMHMLAIILGVAGVKAVGGVGPVSA